MTDNERAAASLRAVMSAVEAGELTAGPDQLAWLRGALDMLGVVAAAEARVVADHAVSEP